MSECRSCHAQIIWAETEQGSRIPLDPVPVPNGNLEPLSKGSITIRYVTADPDVKRFKSHFATCPNAKRHRRVP